MKTKLFLTVCLATAFITTSAGAATIYFDDFDGLAGDNLAGTKPDTTVGTTTWVANGNTTFKANGDSIANSPITEDGGIWLPFMPVAGNIYILSADINTTAGGGDWIALGYTSSAPDTTFHQGAGGLGNVLLRANRGTNDKIQFFSGLNTAGKTEFSPPTGTVSLAITLDASNANSAMWTESLSINGVNQTLGSNQPSTGNTYANITHVGFSTLRTAAGTVDNFRLESVPEPSIALLGALGVLGLLRRRRV